MTTALMILGGMAAVGWVSEALKGPPGWQEMTARWSAPVPPPAPQPRANKPRIINPLEQQTYEDVKEIIVTG